MPEINNSLAMQVNANPIDLKSTLGTLSQIQLSQAHAGLYGLQAQQEARKLGALQYLKENPTDYLGYIQQGGDPSIGSTLQQMSERERAYGVTPGHISPESYSQLSTAGKNVAETGLATANTGKSYAETGLIQQNTVKSAAETGLVQQNTLKSVAETGKVGAETDLTRQNTAKSGAETKGIGLEQSAKIAQGVIADPSNDSVWQSAVDQHYQTFGGPSLERQQLLGVKDPAQRLQIAKAYAAQGVAPSTFGAPHNVPPTDAVTTPGAAYAVPRTPGQGAPLPASQQGGMIGAPGERILGGAIVQDNGVTVPNQQVASRFGALPPAMTPGQQKESTEYGGEMAKVLPVLTDKANNSRQANFTLDQMRQESQSWDMGKGGKALMTAQQYLKPLANSLGSDAFDKPVADFESFQKNAGTLTRQAVKEVSSRAAVQEFSMIQNQLPSADMSRRGFNQIADQFQSVNDFNIAKQQAAQAWRDKTGTMDKFEADWNKNISPAAFLIARLPPDQLGELKGKLSQSPQGRATLNSITRQVQWAHDNNLDQAAQ